MKTIIISWILFIISILAVIANVAEMLKSDELYQRIASFIDLIIWYLVLVQSYAIIQ